MHSATDNMVRLSRIHLIITQNENVNEGEEEDS